MDELEDPLAAGCALVWAGRIQDGQLQDAATTANYVCLLRTDKVRPLTRWSSVHKTLRPLQTAKSWAHNAGSRLIAGAGRINDDQLDAGCCDQCKLPSLGLAVWAPTYVYLLRADRAWPLTGWSSGYDMLRPLQTAKP